MERESNLKRIKNIITDVLKQPDSKIPLKDRIKLLFKVEGLTIAAIITAVIMTFSTLGLAISNSLKGSQNPSPTPSPTPSPPDKPPSIPDKVKEGLKKLAEWLKELAKKSVTALPGIIGYIVSFILKAAGSLITLASQHVVLLAIAIVGTIIFGLIEKTTGFKRYRPTSVKTLRMRPKMYN